jgi:hypothetical protein
MMEHRHESTGFQNMGPHSFQFLVSPGIPHHITQRGNRRIDTFLSEADFREHLYLLAEWFYDDQIIKEKRRGETLAE